ncbi:multiple organellar RNA editing factor 1, mitochondrial-like [Ziziphus jujuba]|uniref:Multiple organellar RNA editing factor 1, mitochondrial-like n=1 Tax=Ziziphus jujuba TaxID=326968 RepID=A0ABM4ADQ6_ZIZJJ|nr:multiple organellar RNA editing factor 1, mitochondrial-like [Ziziphus jujuba]
MRSPRHDHLGLCTPSVVCSPALSGSPSTRSPGSNRRVDSVFVVMAYNSSNNQSGEIGPDTILFEGCDYNHCLIVMDFPKDQKIPPKEMVPMYKETCAKGLNISVEEAKKKIYACSTTTYVGFQAVMIEEESEKFHELPGVVFVLPDSYIDPQNKEYGGIFFFFDFSFLFFFFFGEL